MAEEMIRKSLSLVALWLVLAVPAIGADAPKLSVTGGKVLVIDAVGLAADTIKEFTPIDAGDGKWIVILSTASSGQLKVYKYPVVVGNSVLPGPGPGPLPPPLPPPLPQPLDGLAKVSYDAALKVDAVAKVKAGPLADAIEGLCAAVAAGKYKSVEEARSAMPKAAAEALGDMNDKWVEWATVLAKELDRLAAGGKLATLADYRTTWLEVARGLREVK
jgi:hypothetical protein